MRRLEQLKEELKGHSNKARAAGAPRFFKTGPGQYGAGDVFLGLRGPLQRQIAAKYRDLGLPAIKNLLASPIHEFRQSGLFILVAKYEAAPDLKDKKLVADFYLAQRRRVNNWDLVDLSAPQYFRRLPGWPWPRSGSALEDGRLAQSLGAAHRYGRHLCFYKVGQI
jgi:hypothetical protein